MQVRPISGTLGAELLGVDLSRPLSDEQVARIRATFLAHGVIFFRDQNLSVEQQKAFARRFGELTVHPYVKSGADPEIVEVARQPNDDRVIGDEWHSDIAMQEMPPMASILYAVELPPAGGDTMFSCQYRAYDTLSSGMKQLLEGRRALNSDRLIANPALAALGGRNYAALVKPDPNWKETCTYHPIVRTHPETGRKSIFVNATTTVCIEDMTEEESKPILEFLFRHCNRPEYTCRFNWGPGSMAFWDNRCTNHYAINDTAGHRRLLRRIHLKGDKPR